MYVTITVKSSHSPIVLCHYLVPDSFVLYQQQVILSIKRKTDTKLEWHIQGSIRVNLDTIFLC